MTPASSECVAWVARRHRSGIGAGCWLDRRSHAVFPHAWLAALTVWLGWPLGCMALLLIHALTGGRWGYAIRPQLLAGIEHAAAAAAGDCCRCCCAARALSVVRARTRRRMSTTGFYLNLPFSVGRGIVYLVVWFGLAGLMLAGGSTDMTDRTAGRLRRPGLILLA